MVLLLPQECSHRELGAGVFVVFVFKWCYQFTFSWAVRGILVTRPGIEPTPSAVKVLELQSLSLWTAWEILSPML